MLAASTGWAQTVLEAYKFSALTPGGTARGYGLSGAMGALGADQTALTINPAGLGFYRHSEVTVTGGLMFTNATSNLFGTKTDDSRTNFNLGNAGLVFTKLFQDKAGNPSRGNWRSISLGLSFNRFANFNSSRTYINNGTNQSILQDYVSELNTSFLTPDQINTDNFSFGTVTGYNTYLLNPDPIDDSLTTSYNSVTQNTTVDQRTTINTRGGVDELAIGFGTNYNDKFYFGGSLGIPLVNYQEDITITETNTTTPDTINHFDHFTQTNHQSITGAGINAKFGFVVRPNNYFRIGASIHSPNMYSLSNKYNTGVSSYFDSSAYSDYQEGYFDYKLKSPFRAIGSAAVFFKQYGFFSLDYEYADYGRSKYIFPKGFEYEQSLYIDAIKATLQKTHTIRTGLEFAIDKFRLRAGYAYTTSPIKAAARIGGADYSSMTFSGGFGFRLKHFYTDLAYYHNKVNTATSITNEEQATNTLKNNYVALTLGFTF